MDGIIAVFFVNKCIENTDILFSLFLASGPSPVWKQKASYQACVKQLHTTEQLLEIHSDEIQFHYVFVFLKLSHLFLNAYASKPRLGSSGRIATYIPILYPTLVLSHL